MSVYGLTREYLQPDPKVEPLSFFGPRRQSAEKLVLAIKDAVETNRSIKMVLFGLYGIGKTHLIFYVMAQLGSLIEIYYLECPSCHRRTRFIELHSIMMGKIGRAAFMKILRNCIEEFQGQSSRIQNFLGIDADFVEVLKKGLIEDESLLWRYLLGGKLTSAQMITLSAVKPQIDDLEASRIVSITAKLFEKFEGKKILFVVDEMEKTDPLMGDSMNAYRDTLRDLMDSGNSAGILMISSHRDLEDFRLLNDDPIQRRIGLNNFKVFRPYEDDELLQLMKEVINAKRKEGFPLQEKIDSAKTEESLDKNNYPFTEEALNEILRFINYCVDNGIGKITGLRPNELLQIMDLAITEAKHQQVPAIDKKIIEEVETNFAAAVTPEAI